MIPIAGAYLLIPAFFVSVFLKGGFVAIFGAMKKKSKLPNFRGRLILPLTQY
jgi:hypothetical protein